MRSVALALICVSCATPAESAPEDPYLGHTAALKKKLDKKGLRKLQIRTEQPFVVISNGTADDAANGASIVHWTVSKLEADFFAARPDKILDIYLFRDAASYERGVKKLTGEAPTTPYGFYSRAHEGLFMNIATGGGTLVHELVHPYVEADFPDAPTWLNEGLGSLFEQSAEKDGHIIGLTNWRLAGLQKRDRRGRRAGVQQSSPTRAPTSSTATTPASTTREARYLLYYLQQQGTLRDVLQGVSR